MTTERFAVVGDLQETQWFELLREDNRAERGRLVRRLADLSPAFLVLLGDLVADGSSPAHWGRFDALLAPLCAAAVPLFPILGNHDYWWGGAKNLRHFEARFPHLGGRRWHRARFHSVELLFLDSNFAAQPKGDWARQCAWLGSALEAADADPEVRATLLFAHHPPFTNSVLTRGSTLVERCFAAPFLRARKTRALVSGHVHSYERFERDGKAFIVAGAGGGPRVRLFCGASARHRDRYIEREARGEAEARGGAEARGEAEARGGERWPSAARRFGPSAVRRWAGLELERGVRPLHYLAFSLEERAIRVEVVGLVPGGFAPMETFELALS